MEPEQDQEDNGNDQRPSWSHPGNQPDEYVECPYFPEHKLRRSRMPYHLMKCQNNPRAPKLLACPYNFMHRVREDQQMQHLLVCEDKPKRRYKDRSNPSYKKTVKEGIKMRYQTNEPDPPAHSDKVPVETNEEEWW